MAATSQELRNDAEQKLAALLRKLAPSFRGRILAALRQYGSAAAIPPGFWIELQREIADKATEEVLLALMLFYSHTENELGITNFARDDVSISAAPTAVRITQRAGAQWLDSVRNRLITPRGKLADLSQRELLKAATDDSIDNAARDAATRARTAARRSAAGDYEKRRALDGFVVTTKLIWRNHPELSESGPCTFCESLEGMSEFGDKYGGGGWAEYAPEGSPAHPFCVCDQEVVVVMEGDEDE